PSSPARRGRPGRSTRSRRQGASRVTTMSGTTDAHDDASAGPPAAVTASITPAPTDEEVAAIMAAMEALWPRPVVAAEPTTGRRRPGRLSGGWGALPLPGRRARPWP